MHPRCKHCGKYSYHDRKTAKQSARDHHDRKLHVYRCPHGPVFHLGHIPSQVLRGEVESSRSQPYRKEPHQGRYTPKAIAARFQEMESTGEMKEIGSVMASCIASLHRRSGRNPTWNEAFQALPDQILLLIDSPSEEWNTRANAWKMHARHRVMVRLRDLGWITFDGRDRSLQIGPMF